MGQSCLYSDSSFVLLSVICMSCCHVLCRSTGPDNKLSIFTVCGCGGGLPLRAYLCLAGIVVVLDCRLVAVAVSGSRVLPSKLRAAVAFPYRIALAMVNMVPHMDLVFVMLDQFNFVLMSVMFSKSFLTVVIMGMNGHAFRCLVCSFMFLCFCGYCLSGRVMHIQVPV